MNDKTFHILSLGCAKNTVDADSMAQLEPYFSFFTKP